MVYVLMTDGFEETELIVPVDILRRGGVEVSIVGVNALHAVSTRGITIQADMMFDDRKLDGMDMLVLPGGQPGVDHLWANERVRDFITQVNKEKKYIGAICAAPMILGRLGILEGVRAVCYPGCEDELKGALVAEDVGVVSDDFIITARGAGFAFAFGLALLQKLEGQDIAERVAEQMQYSVCRHG